MSEQMEDAPRFSKGGNRLAAPMLSFLLFLSIFFLPVFGWVLNFFAPLPLVYYFFTSGRKPMHLMIILGTTIISTLFSIHLGMLYLLSYALLALVMAEFILRKQYMGQVVAMAAFSAMAATAVYFWLSFPLPMGELAGVLQNEVHKLLDQAVSSYRKAGVPQEQIDFMVVNADAIARWVVYLLPSTAAVGYLGLSLTNYLGYRTIQSRWTYLPPTDPMPVIYWTPPERAVFLLIAGGIMAMLTESFLQAVGVNLLIIMGSVYSLAGLCITQFYFVKFAVPFFLRWTAYILILLQPFLLIVVAGIGLFDLWFDFRKIRLKDGETKEE